MQSVESCISRTISYRRWAPQSIPYPFLVHLLQPRSLLTGSSLPWSSFELDNSDTKSLLLSETTLENRSRRSWQCASSQLRWSSSFPLSFSSKIWEAKAHSPCPAFFSFKYMWVIPFILDFIYNPRQVVAPLLILYRVAQGKTFATDVSDPTSFQAAPSRSSLGGGSTTLKFPGSQGQSTGTLSGIKFDEVTATHDDSRKTHRYFDEETGSERGNLGNEPIHIALREWPLHYNPSSISSNESFCRAILSSLGSLFLSVIILIPSWLLICTIIYLYIYSQAPDRRIISIIGRSTLNVT